MKKLHEVSCSYWGILTYPCRLYCFICHQDITPSIVTTYDISCLALLPSGSLVLPSAVQHIPVAALWKPVSLSASQTLHLSIRHFYALKKSQHHLEHQILLCRRNKNGVHTCLVQLYWTRPHQPRVPTLSSFDRPLPKVRSTGLRGGKAVAVTTGLLLMPPLTSWSDWLTPGQARALPQEEKGGGGDKNHASYSRPLEHRSIPIRVLMMNSSHLANLQQTLG